MSESQHKKIAIRQASGVDNPQSTGVGSDWKAAFDEKSASSFAEAFAEDVILEGTVQNSPIAGRENVKRVMSAASKIYESLTFTEHASAGMRQYLEWKAKAFGGIELAGITILTRNEQGAICHIAIHHRPLQAVILFSTHLGESLRGEIDSSCFLPSAGDK